MVVEGKSGEEIGSKQCVNHYLPRQCMATWRNRILELEIGGGERNICVCVDVCERRGKDLK
jgi:hypothetical protein